MAPTLTLWFDRLFSNSRLGTPSGVDDRPPMTIVVDRLPDYQWRDLGFVLPLHPDQVE